MFGLLARNAEEMKDTLAKLLEVAAAFPCFCIFSAWAPGMEKMQWQVCRKHWSAGVEGRAGLNSAGSRSLAE